MEIQLALLVLEGKGSPLDVNVLLEYAFFTVEVWVVVNLLMVDSMWNEKC